MTWNAPSTTVLWHQRHLRSKQRAHNYRNDDKMMDSSTRYKWRIAVVVSVALTAVGAGFLVLYSPTSPLIGWLKGNGKATFGEKEEALGPLRNSNSSFPPVLLETVYKAKTDFRNDRGIVPSFWDEMNTTVWGPCYAPNSNRVDWGAQIQRWHGSTETDYHPKYHLKRHGAPLAGYCRPGFIIVGAGKCGTSSLYHYLVGHPRVLPASEKQIHYFKYHTAKGIAWYLAHFPTATSFLAAGALMTGEASPGYLPYPNVAAVTAKQMPGSKIIAIGRHPIERAWSSYNYNYVNPTLQLLARGAVASVPGGKSAEYYQDYLFSFEELIRSELTVLRECFAPGGPGETTARQQWGDKDWAIPEFERREREGLPPLIGLDESCYGGRVSPTIPRKQWKELLERDPRKVVDSSYMFLTQSLVGRSLYVFPLEWWYTTFPKEDIYFVCTEELKDMSGEPLNQVGQFLGLSSYDFSSVVGEGMFNVGGHKGYDKATSWQEVEEERPYNSTKAAEKAIPISAELRSEFEAFVKPYNERLFELVGRRCDW